MSLTYILDTNVIADISNPRPHHAVMTTLRERRTDNAICLCEPVLYEIERGWHHRKAPAQLARFRQNIFPLFQIVMVQRADWQAAALLWGNTRRNGYQLSDVDLLIAAMTMRLDAILVTADHDFSVLPLQTENWRDS